MAQFSRRASFSPSRILCSDVRGERLMQWG
jgi:hypothetical protein